MVFSVNETDRLLLNTIQDQLPDCVFDAHAHPYRVADMKMPPGAWFDNAPQQAGLSVWRSQLGEIIGHDRLKGLLCIAYPTADGDMDASNQFVIKEAVSCPGSAASIVVTPMSDRATIERLVEENPIIKGFKPYHVFSSVQPTFEANISDFMPEWAWEIADRKRMSVTIHVVHERAIADKSNQQELDKFSKKYPGATIILAHAGRGFHAPNTLAGVSFFKCLDNVYFDSSAICESEPLFAILEELGPRRLLYGSDFPVSSMRQKAVTVGLDFSWIAPSRIDVHENSPICRPTLVGIESLRALLHAIKLFGGSKSDIIDVFHDNAMRVFKLRMESGKLTQNLYAHARKRIPGGTQLLSKRPEMFAPGAWPAYFREARGCNVWDLDGRRYVDMTLSGIGACALGFGDPDVTSAVLRRVRMGSMCTLNPPEEVELADRLCAIHPWAEQARFARSGGEIAAVAVRIARATTGRSAVAICGYHGWHDWYLASNLGESDALRGHLLPGLEPAGVPSELRGTALPFTFNDKAAFQNILDQHSENLAAVIMEPCRNKDSDPGFLEFIRTEAHRAGALLIFDEITVGWRLLHGGAHLRLGIAPDMAVFAKALGNGHPIAALIGARAAMAGAEDSFISSTYWTESVGPAAALATLDKLERVSFPDHAFLIGSLVQAAWRDEAAAAGVPIKVTESYPALSSFKFEHPEADALRALFTTLMLKQGFLASAGCYPSLAHTEKIVSEFRSALRIVFREIGEAIDRRDIRSRLAAGPAHSGFRRLL